MINDNQYQQLYQELSSLREENLMTEDQMNAICLHLQNASAVEASRKKDIFILILTSIGILLLGLAILLVLSFNWHAMAPMIKLAIVFGSLFTVYVAAIIGHFRHWDIMSELLFFLGLILFGVNIWQISQIFNIGFYRIDGLLYWTCCSFFLAWFMKKPFAHVGTAALLIIWACIVDSRSGMLYLTPLDNILLILIMALAGLVWAGRNHSDLTSVCYLLVIYITLIKQPFFLKPYFDSDISVSVYIIGLAGLFFFIGSNISHRKIIKAFCYLVSLPLYFGIIFFYSSCCYTNYRNDRPVNSVLLPCIILLFFYLIAFLPYYWRQKSLHEKWFGSNWLLAFLSPTVTSLLFIAVVSIVEILCLQQYSWNILCTTSNIFIFISGYYFLYKGRYDNTGWYYLGAIILITWALLRYIDLFGNIGMLGSALYFSLMALVLFFGAWIKHRSDHRIKKQHSENNIILNEKETFMFERKKPNSGLKTNRIGLLLSLLVQLVILGTMIGSQTLPFLQARELTVETRAIDPRDYFCGDYVVLNYEFSRVLYPLWQESTKNNSSKDSLFKRPCTVYTELKYDEQKNLYTPVKMGYEKPTEGVFLKGKKVWNNVFYGIETLYVQEGKGKILEQAMRNSNSHQKVQVQLLVNNMGDGKIKEVKIVDIANKTDKSYNANSVNEGNKDDKVNIKKSKSNNISIDMLSFTDFASGQFGTLAKITDWHIHLRGGMTAKKALERTRQTRIISGVLENHGRDWPLSDNGKLKTFIESVELVRKSASLPLFIGIQVNDRDWYKTIDPKLYRRLDYVLADTMIMGVNSEGKPQKLWLLPEDYKTDKDKWFAQYLEHNLQILDEPIDILANPTYMPKFIAADYDKYWNDENMNKVIQKAVKNDIALEIQAESDFPKERFVQLAKRAGAKFTFGTNNFDDKPKKLDTWCQAIEKYQLKQKDIKR